METISLYYFSEAAKDLHITETANRLHITQQTLSNHILRLERDFGAQLLNRKPSVSLTYAGEFVLAFAETVLKEQTNLTDILSDIEQSERGVIRFGASSMRMNTLAAILPSFIERYPNVELRLSSTISQKLEPMVLNGELDMAIVISEKTDPEMVLDDLMEDQIFLCASDTLLRKYYGDEAEEIKARSLNGADIKDFARLPFCILSNYMGERIHKCFDECGVTPRTRMTSYYSYICTTVGFQGSAAFFSSHVNLTHRQGEIPDNMNIFPLLYRGEPMFLHISLLRHRQRYLTHYAKYFRELLSDYCAAVEHTPVARLARTAL